jgi:hypothetical protein
MKHSRTCSTSNLCNVPRPLSMRDKYSPTIFLMSIISERNVLLVPVANSSTSLSLLVCSSSISLLTKCQCPLLILQSLQPSRLILLALMKPLPRCSSSTTFHLYVSSFVPIQVSIRSSSIWLVFLNIPLYMVFLLCSLHMWCFSHIWCSCPLRHGSATK